jgi:outer membrane receptor protein involved in Fe transport
VEDDGSNLDDISPDTFLALVRKEFGERAYAQTRLAFLAKDGRPGPSEIAAPGASVIDLAAGYRLSRNLELRGIVRNLLDDSYYASPDPRWVWAAGRAGSLTLAVRF